MNDEKVSDAQQIITLTGGTLKLSSGELVANIVSIEAFVGSAGADNFQSGGAAAEIDGGDGFVP